ncbi:MAG: hypothetical protein AMXMBFR34_29220 [Myxococcaceae bacterium]
MGLSLRSVERLLSACFEADPPVSTGTTKALLVTTEQLVKQQNGSLSFTRPALTIFPYRLEVNRATRAAWAGASAVDGRAHLPLDLHFLITPWATDAEHELRILGKAIECLDTTPILAGPLLKTADAAWAPNEGVQVMMDEVATDTVMRTFDVLPTDYKLSVPYIARVVRVDGKRAFADPTATEVKVGMRPLGAK